MEGTLKSIAERKMGLQQGEKQKDGQDLDATLDSSEAVEAEAAMNRQLHQKEVSIDLTKHDDLHQTNPVSPTAALAKGVGTDSHKLQLMKASFFNDEDMADGKSVTSENLDGHTTPDQLVPKRTVF